jgi:hypothetical protein
MDLSFFRRAEERFASRAPAAFDFGMLVATLRMQRAAEDAPRVPARAERPADPLVEILLGGPSWRAAVAAQRGCFNARFALQGAVN